MKTYLDTSVLLRVVLGQPDRLAEWDQISEPVTSALTEVECLRTLDRRLRQGLLTHGELSQRRGLALQLLERVARIELTPVVLRRAAEPFPLPLGTLDALHLASLVLWSEAQPSRGTLATHDRELGAAAASMGFTVLGLPGAPL